MWSRYQQNLEAVWAVTGNPSRTGRVAKGRKSRCQFALRHASQLPVVAETANSRPRREAALRRQGSAHCHLDPRQALRSRRGASSLARNLMELHHGIQRQRCSSPPSDGKSCARACAFQPEIDSKLRGTREAVQKWIKQAGLKSEDFVFPSRIHDSPRLGTRQYARILEGWVEELGLDRADYGTHSMRRTKATLIYRRTKNLRAVQLLLGHSKLESTVLYLGIEVDDALEISEQTEI